MTKDIICYSDAILVPNTDIIITKKHKILPNYGECSKCQHYTPCKKYYKIHSFSFGCEDWLDNKTPIPESLEWLETLKGWKLVPETIGKPKNYKPTIFKNEEVEPEEPDNDDKYLPYFSSSK